MRIEDFERPGEVVTEHPKLEIMPDGSQVFDGVEVEEVRKFSGTPAETVNDVVECYKGGVRLVFPAEYGDQSIVAGVKLATDKQPS